MAMTENKIRKHYDQLMPAYRRLGLPVVGDVQLLRRLAIIEKTLHKWAEDACSVQLDERTERRRETLEASMLDEVRAMLPVMADAVISNGDPRGWALKLHDWKLKSFYEEHDVPASERLARDWGGFGLLSPDAQGVN